MYIAGELGRMNETVFEALCLIEAIGRLGVRDQVTVIVSKATAENVVVALLKDKLKEGDLCLFVRAQGQRTTEIELAFGEHEKDERGINLSETLEWFGAVGPLPFETREEFTRAWDRAVESFKEAPYTEAEPLWERSRARRVMAGLEASLRGQGFKVDAGVEAPLIVGLPA